MKLSEGEKKRKRDIINSLLDTFGSFIVNQYLLLSNNLISDNIGEGNNFLIETIRNSDLYQIKALNYGFLLLLLLLLLFIIY